MGLNIFVLPPHTTQVACPLDTHVFKAVKSKWDACRTKNPGFLRQPELVRLFDGVLLECFADGQLRKGFADCGLVPPKFVKMEAKTAEHKADKQREEDEALEAALRTRVIPRTTPPVFACRGVQTNARELAHTEPCGLSGERVVLMRKVTFEGGLLTEVAEQRLVFDAEEALAKKRRRTAKPAPKASRAAGGERDDEVMTEAATERRLVSTLRTTRVRRR